MSNSSGDTGPDVVKAAEPRAADAAGRGDGGPAKAGPKRPPRPGSGVRTDGATDESRPAKPATRPARSGDDKAAAAKTAEGKPAAKKSPDGKPGASKPGGAKPSGAKPSASRAAAAKPGASKPAAGKPVAKPEAGSSNASRPSLRRRSEPISGPLDGSDGDRGRSGTARDETERSGSRTKGAPAAGQSPAPPRSTVAAPALVGSDRDATLVTDRPEGAVGPSDAPVEGRSDAAAQPRPAATGAPTRRRGRRVKRVVRRIELWSVLKLSLVLLTCLYAAVLVTLIVIWNVAYSSGQIENLQKFLADVGLENYRFYGDRMFKACAAIGAVGVLAGTVLMVMTTALINLISEMTGGIRLVVIEEDPPPRR